VPYQPPAVPVTRRQKEARRAMERQIALRSEPATVRQSGWARLRDGYATTRTNLAKAQTRSIWGGVLAILIFVVPFAWFTADHLATLLILDARGVTVEAVVDHRSAGRGPDSLYVRTLDAPSFEAKLDHWPRDLQVGDRFELTYDPEHPTRAAAVGTPLIDAMVIGFAILDLLILPLAILLVPVSVELVGRARIRLAARHAQKGAVETPPTLIQGVRRGYGAAVDSLRYDASTQPRLMAFTVHLLLPVLVVLASGGFLVVQAVQAAALYQRGVSHVAVVEDTNMVSGWLEYADVRFVPHSSGRTVRTTTTHLVGPHFEGTPLGIVYDPTDPKNVIEAGAIPWGWAEWTATTVFVAAGAFGAASIPAAVPTLLHRTRRT
jgi:hypothetical protein